MFNPRRRVLYNDDSDQQYDRMASTLKRKNNLFIPYHFDLRPNECIILAVSEEG